MAIKKKYGEALGRGLDALLATDEEVTTGGSSNICEVETGLIRANPNQPRRDFDDDSLQELANSIRQIGIIQPITVRDMGDGSYVIIAGERRWRASKLAGRLTIPAYIRTIDDENMMEMALVENIQREDLNSVEVALAYQHLIEQYGLTQDQLAQRVGKNRSTVTNFLRLLKLPAVIQMALKEKEIDMGHARALLALSEPEQQIKVFQQIKAEGLSVRRVEMICKELNGAKNDDADAATQKTKSTAQVFADLKRSLSDTLRVKVALTCNDKGNGRITIPFADESELERLMEMFDQIKH